MGGRAHIIGRLKEAATLLTIGGEYTQAEAYQRAAGVLSAHSSQEGLDVWLNQHRLDATSDWEKQAWADALACWQGRSVTTIEQLRTGLPVDVVRLLRIRGMSPHRISVAWREFGIDSLTRLKEALATGELAMTGLLDEATMDQFPRIVAEYEAACKGWLRPVVAQVADLLLGHLSSCLGQVPVVQVGDASQLVPVANCVEVLVSCEQGAVVQACMQRWPERVSPLSHGPSWVSCTHASGVPCVVAWCAPQAFGFQAYRLRSTSVHWASLTQAAARMGYEIRHDAGFLDAGGRLLPLAGEEELVKLLGLTWMPPELRWGPVWAHGARQSPTPVRLEQIRGDLHCHSTYSDGADCAENLLEVARAREYEYLAVTDHTQSTWIAGGLGEREIPAYMEALCELRARHPEIRLLSGLEVDILEDGRLDMPDAILEQLDVVIASVHSEFHLSTGAQLRRIARAMEHPLVHVLAHPTGRLLGKRSSLPIPVEALVDQAARTGTWLELNSNPERLDLWGEGLRRCKVQGVPVVISSDAHHAAALSQVRWGIDEARRAGLEAADVVNTRPLPELLDMLKRKRTNRS